VELSKVQVSVPPLREQAAIAAVLSDMDAEIAAMKAKLAKTRLLKLPTGVSKESRMYITPKRPKLSNDHFQGG
jgi:hypothetical protein